MNNKVVGLTALASAALASVCCIGPAVLAALGIGSLGLAAGLTPYRPLFLAATAVILAVAFYFAYRKRPVACPDGSCELRSSSRTMKAVLWIVTALAVGVATFPNWSAWVLASGPVVAPAGAQTLALKISGMDCAACTVAIKKSVEKIPGVLSASIDFDTAEATVITNDKVDPQAVVNAVSVAGYKAAIIARGEHGKPGS